MIAWLVLAMMGTGSRPAADSLVLSGPDSAVRVSVGLRGEGEPYYRITYHGLSILDVSTLGIVRDDGDFTKGMHIRSIGAPTYISESYQLRTGKRTRCRYTAIRRVIHFDNTSGQPMDIIWQVSAQSVAFRYFFPAPAGAAHSILEERTSFHFDTTTRTWLQPMSDPKTGWSQVNPCYEEYYVKDGQAGHPSPLASGWVFPALFERHGVWVSLTEAGVDGHYCASRLKALSPGGEYQLGFPGPLEIFPGGPSGPVSVLPWYTPWRIIALGSLASIIESTAGTDLAPAQTPGNYIYVKPGKASWSWPLLKDDSIIYPVQKHFIDYAADMHWQYTLIDVNWDTQIGMDSIRSLIRYAHTKNVGIWLWYNSSGSWNTTPYHPKSRLLTHGDREKVFADLEAMGVAGVKIDFFGGDGSSMMQYYMDILHDAAAHHLMVNFHGATLPRGWERTYPNLITTEAVKGFEYLTFEQINADEEAAHCATLPFTRNVFDPMDFTPMCLDSIPRILRRTTPAFELALSVLFLSGVQHFAEISQGMAKMPPYVKSFLQDLPVQWDDTRFISGYPGQWVALARRSGGRWYLCGINATNEPVKINLDLPWLKGRKGFLISDSDKPGARFNRVAIPDTLRVIPKGGFVAVME